MDKTSGSEFRTVRGYQLANRQADHLTPALEDYLEMVYRLCLESRYARVGKLSEVLHVKPSSASKMVFRLVDLGYLEYDRYDSILLTEKGKELGAYLLKRHDIVERFLGYIGNPPPWRRQSSSNTRWNLPRYCSSARFWSSFRGIEKRESVTRHSGKKRKPRDVRSLMSNE